MFLGLYTLLLSYIDNNSLFFPIPCNASLNFNCVASLAHKLFLPTVPIAVPFAYSGDANVFQSIPVTPCVSSSELPGFSSIFDSKGFHDAW